MLTALPTTYNKQRFRSRLESRWAYFLDRLTIPWEYEKEAYQLRTGVYVPDFFLNQHRAWLEIKGEIITDEIGLGTIRKCSQLAAQSATPVILAFNDPLEQRCTVFGVRGGFYSQAHFTICRTCAAFGVNVRTATGARFLCPNGGGHKPVSLQTVQTARRFAFEAATAARKHRFSISRKAA